MSASNEKRNVVYRPITRRLRTIPPVRDAAAGVGAAPESGAPVTMKVGAQDLAGTVALVLLPLSQRRVRGKC